VLGRALTGFWRLLCSVRLAVIVILGLAVSLATGTFIESLHDTPTAQYYVYRSLWFHLWLGLLGTQIFCVAIDRYPWKKRHIPFLLAHVGILTLLTGAWLTERFGLDGQLRITEGETSAVVELEQSSFVVSDREHVYSIPVRWTPTDVEFSPIHARDAGVPYELVVDKFLTHADPVYDFLPAARGATPKPAVHLLIEGGPMRIKQDYWMWAERGWSALQAGPASVAFGAEPAVTPGRPSLGILPMPDGSLELRATSSSGARVVKKIARAGIAGATFDPGWKGNVQITVSAFLPDAILKTSYKPSRAQDGKDAPQSAIHVLATSEGGVAESWLGLGERATLHLGSSDVDLGYFPQRLVLPFSLRLERFTIDHDQGTQDPSSYASRVTVLDSEPGRRIQKEGSNETLISMNEPLVHGGITFYQASYEDALPRPVTSILQVNRDPGRFWKYLGSILLVFGTILLFVTKVRHSRAHREAAAAHLDASPAPTGTSLREPNGV
jgi:hypothetical protein